MTTHIGDLKTYALSTPGTENAAVEFDDETLRPKYRLHIGDIGQSNALKIARHLKLAEHIVARAESYRAQRRGGEIPELEILQKLRKEAEEAREGALRAQAEAERTREALARRLAELQDETRQAETIAEARARLQPGDRVVVPRLGYDRPGRLVKLDPRKKTAVVAIGHVTWDVAIDELIPQTVRTPATAAPATAGQGGVGPADGPAGRIRRRMMESRGGTSSEVPIPGARSWTCTSSTRTARPSHPRNSSGIAGKYIAWSPDGKRHRRQRRGLAQAG